VNDSATLIAAFLGRTLQYGSGMLLVNAAVFRWLVLPARPAPAGKGDALARFDRLLDSVFLMSAGALLLSGITLFIAAAAGMSGTPLLGAFDPTLLSTVLLQTEFGRVCQVRCLLAGLLALAIGCSFFQRNRRPGMTVAFRGLTTLLAAALFLSVAWTSHAAAMNHPGFRWPLLFDASHLALTAVWPGGLLPFALFLGCMKESYRTDLNFIRRTVRRFSTVSLVAVGGLALTGFANGCFLVGSFAHLLDSAYGHVLDWKLLVFAAMLGVAAWNRQMLLPRLFAHDGNPERAAVVGRLLRRFVIAEVVLAAVVILIVAVLGVTPPPVTSG
jgi:putative copper resistance protein D